MKLLIATDIHGSSYWAKRVVDKLIQTRADALVLLGDVYNHGPRNPFPAEYAPMEVAAALNSVADKIIAVTGNCDSEVDQMISDFPFVRDSVIPLENRRLYFTHGHVFNKDSLPNLSRGDVMFYGHFHVSEITSVNGITCVNVGSAALPKDGANVYCVADDNAVTIYDFDDNVIKTVSL